MDKISILPLLTIEENLDEFDYTNDQYNHHSDIFRPYGKNIQVLVNLYQVHRSTELSCIDFSFNYISTLVVVIYKKEKKTLDTSNVKQRM